jgi:hypothetical protein
MRKGRIKNRTGGFGAWSWRAAIALLAFGFVIGQALPARAGDTAGAIEIAFDLPATMQAHSGAAASDVAPVIEPVSQQVLAAQRGSGATFALPVLPAAQSQPGIVLWDEVKPPQSQNIAVPGGQSVNQVNPVQFR